VVMWAYLGSRRFLNSPAFEAVSIPQQVGPEFPPALVSAGNGDPLLPHSESLVQALRRAGSSVEPLFFPTAEPPLPHEYQFDLEREEGRAAFEVVVDFLERHTAIEKSPR